jgi:hypothetical protein
MFGRILWFVSMYGPWGESQTATAFVGNSTCDCIPDGVNFALTIPSASLGGYSVNISEYELAVRVQNWYHQTRQWWNAELSAAGSSKQIAGGGAYPIYIEDLPGDVAMEWAIGGFGRRIRVDPEVFNLSDAFAATLMAHELGHAIGVSGHSPCGDGAAIMAASLSGPQYALFNGDRCFVYSEHGTFTKTCT